MKKVMFAITCTVLLMLSASMIAEIAIDEFAQYKAEGECIAELVQLTDRKNIVAENGTCRIKGE